VVKSEEEILVKDEPDNDLGADVEAEDESEV
jgi:hypothetical protein